MINCLKKNGYLTFVLLFVIVIVSIGGCQTASSPNRPQAVTTNSNQPETVLTNFLDSLIEMDVKKAASFAVDRRFSDKAEQLKFYEKSLQQFKYLSYKIDNIKKSGNEKVYIDATLNIEQSEKKKEEKYTFRLILVDGQWKVVFPSEEKLEHLYQGGGEGSITFREPE